ncbi:MAG TPA: septal ring lytic transglycosylase RlpA family protein [Phenylobacterium sp.]|nr:septal ring lytic transglycosylase RlpA family protein [Phenylobacterium sp.]
MTYLRYAFGLRPRHGSALALLAYLALAACDHQRDRVIAPPAPAAQPAPAQIGVASYYGRGLAGKPTASGEPHKPNALTAASRTLPLGTTAKVTNTENGKSVTVKVNDRGPYAKDRILDVSRKAAKRLGFKHDGVAQVAVQPLQAPPDAH